MPCAVSIIVPAYNQEHYLEYALDSVAAQSMPDWECVVIDDGSTDGTAALASRYVARDDRFRLVRQSNQGLAGARNAGIAAAEGEYLVFLDSDDGLHPEMLETLTGWLAQRPGVSGVVCGVRLIDEQGVAFESTAKVEARNVWVEMLWALFRESPMEVFSLANLFSPVCGCWRRSAILKAGGFDKAATGLEDFDMWLRVLDGSGPWGRIPASLSDYRRSAGSMSGNRNLMSHGWGVAVGKFFTKRENEGWDAGRIRHWRQLCLAVRDRVFPTEVPDSAVDKPRLDEALRGCGFDAATQERFRLALMAHLILAGAPGCSIRPLGASSQDLALTEVVGAFTGWKQGRRLAAVSGLIRAAIHSPWFVAGPVMNSYRKKVFYPLTDTFRAITAPAPTAPAVP